MQKYNPDLLDKDKLLVLTKSDMIDDELEEEISQIISVDHIFISSVSNYGLDKLKDSIWTLLINKHD